MNLQNGTAIHHNKDSDCGSRTAILYFGVLSLEGHDHAFNLKSFYHGIAASPLPIRMKTLERSTQAGCGSKIISFRNMTEITAGLCNAK